MFENNKKRIIPLLRFFGGICTLFSGIIFLSGCAGLLDSAIRDTVNASHSYDVNYRSDGLLMDGDIGHFKVFTKNMSGDHKPANIPIDAIEYALIEFCGIGKNYPYFNRVVYASQKGLKMKGYTCTYIIQDNKPYMIQLTYRGKVKQLEVDLNTTSVRMKTYAIDLSKVDVEIN